MRGYLPLVGDTIDALEGDELLAEYIGTAVKVYTGRPPDRVSPPFFVLDLISANPWNSGSNRGTDFTVQVRGFFLRTEQGSARGILDVAKAMERVRDTLDDLDTYDLPAGPSDGEAVILDFTPSRFETSGDAPRLIMRQYTSGLPPTPDPEGRFIQAACRFRCLVGVSN